jgi:hypothetical protein
VFSKNATKIEEIFTVDLTITTQCQIDGEDFFNFCGLLRKYKLYVAWHSESVSKLWYLSKEKWSSSKLLSIFYLSTVQIWYNKAQMINKRNCCKVSQKGTNKFFFLPWKTKKQKKQTNLFVRFLEESMARQSAYSFIWSLDDETTLLILSNLQKKPLCSPYRTSLIQDDFQKRKRKKLRKSNAPIVFCCNNFLN